MSEQYSRHHYYVCVATCTVDSAQCSGCVVYGSDVIAVIQSSVIVFSTL